jgi:hypothetical protein
MDKVKMILAVVKKHHFWVLVGLVCVLGLTVYVAAASNLQQKYQERSTTLKSALEQVQTISRQADHPNEKRIEKWKEVQKEQGGKVLEGWQTLYNRQQKENPWPDLGPEFQKMIKSLDPDKDIPLDFRLVYQNFINGTLDSLFKTVDYRRDEQGQPGAAAPPAAAAGKNEGDRVLAPRPNVKTIGIVDWIVSDRERIRRGFNFPTTPSSRQVRLAQEDYWVYKALLTIIQNTNRDATTRSAAAVKQIESIQIGKDAAASIKSLPKALVMPLGEGEAAGEDEGQQGAPVAEGELSADDLLLESRYVRDNLKPLGAAEEPPFKEFKMMPVRMCLVIDQRKIPNLLVECANSTMPVEVKLLRINPGGAGQSSQKSAFSSPVGRKDEGSPSERGGGPSAAALSGDDESNPYAIPIELHGIIYTYLPPKIENLAKGEGAGSEKTTEKAPTESPAPAKPKEADAPAPTAEPAATAPVASSAAPGATPPAPGAPPAAGGH